MHCIYRLSVLFLFAVMLDFQATAQDLAPEDKTISIYFGGGSYYIDSDQEQDLVDFISEIEDIRIYQIEVHGHTDNIGSREFNQYLSQKRSEAVIYNLQELQIPFETIIQYDHGETNPHYSNDSWNGKLHNRRVDIILRRLST